VEVLAILGKQGGSVVALQCFGVSLGKMIQLTSRRLAGDVAADLAHVTVGIRVDGSSSGLGRDVHEWCESKSVKRRVCSLTQNVATSVSAMERHA